MPIFTAAKDEKFFRNSHNPLNNGFAEEKAEKTTIPGTNVKLTKVEKPNKIWTDTWKKTLTESTLFGKMVEDSLKGMAIPVEEFSRMGYKIRKSFVKNQQ